MRQQRLVILPIISVLFAVAGYAALQASLAEPADAATAGVIVQYKPGTDEASLDEAYDDHRAIQTGEIEQLHTDILKVPPSEQADMIETLQADPRVESIEPDFRIGIAATPNDPGYATQYHWKRTATDQVWDSTQGNGLTVAIIDTGINAAHEEFVGRVAAGHDFVNNDDDPADDHGHGTAVAGVVMAAGNNGVGVAGACWNCRVMPLKAAGADGTGLVSGFASAVTYAVDHGAKIINLSVSGQDGSNVEQAAIEYAASKGVLVVAAAGNESSEAPRYPAAFDEVLSVTATNQADDNKLTEGNYGATVDIAAPGETVITTMRDTTSSYGGWSGTSFAAPIVSGVAALLFSLHPEATPAAVRTALTTTADPCCGNQFPGGRVNARKAADKLASLVAVPTPTPTPPAPVPGNNAAADINGSGAVDITDLSILLSNWQKVGGQGDINASGTVDITDLSILLSNWSG